jgi:hypothetical protein
LHGIKNAKQKGMSMPVRNSVLLFGLPKTISHKAKRHARIDT